jgi:molybdopterin-containing oxidoreductase family iron-sulfur binding subunit
MSNAEHPRTRLDLDALRARLAAGHGREYWRSLEELAETPEFEEMLHREFPENASEWGDPAGRRNFLKLMGASLALGGLAACTKQPPETIVPYVRPPEEFIPGKPLYYATAMTLGGAALGLLVESHLGRPTKIEGNELHPGSLGSTDSFAQASILTLYDPDRSQVVMEAGRISTWSAFLAALGRALQNLKARRGQGLRLLTESVASPALAWQIQNLLKEYPEAKWHQFEPAHRDCVRFGAREAFGVVVDTQYRFDRANVVLSLEADFLSCGPAHVRHARDFSARRRVGDPPVEMNRLYVAESTPTNTGGMADHRLALRASEIEALAAGVARRVGVSGVSGGDAGLEGRHAKWMDAVARDLQKHRGASIVIAGETQPAEVHALAHAMNVALGNVERTVIYTDPVEASPAEHVESIKQLAADMAAGRVQVLLMLGGNPVYNAPADLQFEQQLTKVPFRVHLSLYEDETSYLCHWHIPEAHYLETWSDTRAFDGTVTIQQPLIAPLYGGKSAHEFIAAVAGQPTRSGYDIVREYWKARLGEKDFEARWRRALHDGVVDGTALAPRKVTLVPGFAIKAKAAPAGKGLEIVFRTDPTIYDGRFANNGWLQELPKAITRVTWDNVCMVSPATAQQLGVGNEEVVELRYLGRAARGPVWITPGHPDGAVTVFLGYGRRRAGRAGTGAGYDAYALRVHWAQWFDSGLEVVKTGARYPLASTQGHWNIEVDQRAEKRHLVRTATLEEYRKHPHVIREMGHEPPAELTLYKGFDYSKGHAWGMSIDLNACTGCGACVTACQAENNIPIVGKEQVGRGREMHWIRVDRYYRGGVENPEMHQQPVPCMHCENAPCEVVCPVAATVHSDEGLNDMVYNRCVGTRYCSNNCPYKVRRFNFLQFVDDTTPVLKLLRNPDVTVRMRGVMEKCTYCVQRINGARIAAKRDGRPIQDGEIQTACQQVCPAQAIAFGDINDAKSRVARAKAEPRSYGLLTDLNTRPRTTYLARLRNPNPELES